MKKTKALKWILPLIFLGCFYNTLAQHKQSITGTIVDKESMSPIVGAYIQVLTDSVDVVASDIDGNFRIPEVNVGRHTIKVSMIGYESAFFNSVTVISAREFFLKVELEESIIALEGAVVEAVKNGRVKNEMATVSARQFSVEETDRYAGSRGDPARMASNFAGVQGADDSRNDIVIRGNSPSGVVWRVENVDIPNPNHFAIPGTGGGPVSIVNNKILSNSDFFMGAFPAEYGNGIAGVFDLHLRNGNQNNHEVSAQLGFLGTELMAEGPLSKNSKASYLVLGRYSSLSLFSSLGIDIGTDAVPKYGDVAFKAFLPGKNGSSLSLWGIGGASAVDIVISDQIEPDRNIFGENDRDQYFKTGMAIGGLTYIKPIKDNAYFKTTVAASSEYQKSVHELVHRHLDSENQYVVDSINDFMRYNFSQKKLLNSIVYNRKVNSKWVIRAGNNTDVYLWEYQDSIKTSLSGADTSAWRNRWNSNETSALIQPYVQAQFKASEKLTTVFGVHSQFLTHNSTLSPIEPRIGLTYDVSDKVTLTAGAGLHSQVISPYIFFYNPLENGTPYNQDLGFIRSGHSVVGANFQLPKGLSLGIEGYYQHLYDIPVTLNPSSFSIINSGSGFSRLFPDTLVNSGTGRNFGVELTLQKTFNKGFFFLLTASLFDSKYTGSDGVERNTDFNGKYAWNALASKEWKLNQNVTLVTGGKITMAGGRWYGPADVEASNIQREVVFVDSLRNTIQFKDYFRADLKINLRFNRPSTTHEIGLDLVNVLGIENVLKLTYAPDENEDPEASIREEYQLGFLPIFFYRIDF